MKSWRRPEREGKHERHRSGRRRGDAPASDHPGGEQAAAARLRQADGLLPDLGADARRHQGDPHHHHAAGHRALPAALRRRLAARHPLRLCGAADAGRACSGLHDRARIRRRRLRHAGARRQHLLRAHAHRSPARRDRARSRARRSSPIEVQDPRALRRRRLRRCGPRRRSRGKAERRRRARGPSPASTSTTIACSTSPRR